MQQLSKIRWRLVLPVTMAFVSIALMLVAYEQRWMWRGSDSPGPLPATVLAFIVNGPGFVHLPYLDRVIPENLYRLSGYQGERLFGIVLLWFLIGRAIDRKREQKNFSRSHPREALILFGVSLVLSLFMLVVCWTPLVMDRDLSLKILTAVPLMSHESIELAVGIWFAGFSAYFTKKSFEAVRVLRKRRISRK